MRRDVFGKRVEGAMELGGMVERDAEEVSRDRPLRFLAVGNELDRGCGCRSRGRDGCGGGRKRDAAVNTII